VNSSLDLQLLNDYQYDFPLVPAPFAELAARLGVAEKVVLGRLENLRREGRISRVGAVFAPKRIGASTLVALAVPPDKLEAVAAAVNRFPEVNHNDRREHRYNLWFVVTAATEGRLQASLGAIEKAAGHPLLVLPMQEEFHIDTGFSLVGDTLKNMAKARSVQPTALIDEAERRLVSILQEGVPLFIRPFALIAERIGVSEPEVIGRIRRWLEEGAIKRFGVVVRNKESSLPGNALLVHDVPDDQVGQIGRALAEEPAVTLCYRRPRGLPDWPYNLFCMIHGGERIEIEGVIATLRQRLGLESFTHNVLFSLTGLRQNGARLADLQTSVGA
jgi:DNA-binding Lrp family transcriptional regulator